MKKRILFIISNFHTGGVSKSMVSLLNVIDRGRYDVSVMVTSDTGALKELVPADINLITNPIWHDLVSGPKGIMRLARRGHIFLALGHMLRLALSRIDRSLAGRLLARLMPRLDGQWDVAVDYNGQHQLYYMVNKINAPRKITFFHSDYAKWPYYYKADKKYFKSVDHILTISEKCVASLKEIFPEHAHKVGLIENITSLKFITDLAQSNIDDIDTSKPYLLTVGNICKEKGSPWAFAAAKILHDKGYDFNWYFIGADRDLVNNRSLRDSLGVNEYVHFLGIKVNPYPYIKGASIIAHPSTYEGKSIALDEARLLCKPIVVTDFSTVCDQFTDDYDATICHMNPQSLADAIEQLITDEKRRLKYIDNLARQRKDNSDEINKLYELFDI